MSLLTDEELLALARGAEATRVERKASLREPRAKRKARRAVCAFANDLVGSRQPGVLIVGLDDDGTPLGLQEAEDAALTKLGNFVHDGSLQPVPVAEVRAFDVEGVRCAALIVRPHGAPPVRLDGDIWVRAGPRLAKASPEEERFLAERRRAGDRPFEDTPVPEAGLDDLDLDLFRSYLPRAVSPATLVENRRSVEHQLLALRLVDEHLTPRVAGLLLVGREPTHFVPDAYVQLVRYDGADLADSVLDQKRFASPLVSLPAIVFTALDAWNVTPIELDGDLRHRPSPEYPVSVLRELVMNALVHRTYEFARSPVYVRWFVDRVEVQSPGGPFGVVTVENFGQPGLTSYRNQRIAEAMHRLGYVERFGHGLALVRRALGEAAWPLTLELDPTSTFVRAVVRRR